MDNDQLDCWVSPSIVHVVYSASSQVRMYEWSHTFQRSNMFLCLITKVLLATVRKLYQHTMFDSLQYVYY